MGDVQDGVGGGESKREASEEEAPDYGFMKEKFNNETEEMKVHCEEYRLARKESLVPNESEEARNLGFQS